MEICSYWAKLLIQLNKPPVQPKRASKPPTLEGSCEDSCPLKSLNTVQTKTGKVIQGKPEWNVLVTNNCICSQSQIKLACKGFQSVQKIDPLILSKNGDNCLLSNGHILVDSDREAFTYAWDTPYLFIPISSITGPPCNRH
ncbi:uncharacterized protein [Cicer arietinum]|uniref:uncharacterized protein n=1 Tax=Cicer arietinum TaxID=3827 RepID=UPI003CC52F22